MSIRTSVVHLDHSVEAGGAELALARVLERASWRALLVVPRQPDGERGAFGSLGSDAVREIGPFQPPGARAAKATQKLSAAMRIFGAALALIFSRLPEGTFHANSSRAAIYGALAARVRRRAFVIHLRDMVQTQTTDLGTTLFRKISLRSATAVIANSEATLASARPYLSDSTLCVVIPSPIGLEARPRETNVRNVQVVGMVARLAPWKGQHILLQAFARAFPAQDVRLRIVGGPLFQEEGYLERLRRLSVELGINDRVDFTGHVSNVWPEIQKMDICVHAAITPEPLGQNVLQYLAMGKVTVAANAGGPAEWVKDGQNGLLFRPGDSDDLASRLRDLHDDINLRQNLAAGALTETPIMTDAEVSVAHASLFDRVARSSR